MSQMQKIPTPKVESQKNSNLKDSLWLHININIYQKVVQSQFKVWQHLAGPQYLNKQVSPHDISHKRFSASNAQEC